MTFYIGQKVVCIKDVSYIHAARAEQLGKTENYPILNGVYTIRGLYWNNDFGTWGCWLYEIKNEPWVYSDGFIEPNFHYAWFRPIEQRKTDISIFQKMLTDNRVPA